jgi:hypothetical protein
LVERHTTVTPGSRARTAQRYEAADGEVTFDMFEADFTHAGDMAAWIAGIALTESDDEGRIAVGSRAFDALFELYRRKGG